MGRGTARAARSRKAFDYKRSQHWTEAGPIAGRADSPGFDGIE